MPTWLGVTIAVVVVALGITAAYVIGTNRSDAAATPAATPSGDPAQLGVVVSGTGSAIGVPDQLRFTVSVHHSAADVTDAMNATSADVRSVVRALTSAGVAKADIRTASVSVQPTYRYSGGQELITGYAASERVSVKVRDIKVAGKVISATANAAGNAVRIGGISMSVADPSTLQEQARESAIADARTKAEQFATAVGRKLGEVVVVEESTETPQPYQLRRGALDYLAADNAAAVPINPGTQTTKVHVSVRWSFA
jgi:uncharacterized protein YggE